MEKEYDDIYVSQIDSFVDRQPNTINTQDIVKYLACLASKGETSGWIVPINSQTNKFNADMIELGLSVKAGKISNNVRGSLQHIFISEQKNHSLREMDFNKINAIYNNVVLELRIIQAVAGIIEDFTAENNMGIEKSGEAVKYMAALAIKGKVDDGIIDSQLRSTLNKKAYKVGIINQEGIVSQNTQKILQGFFENAPDHIINDGLKAVYKDVKIMLAENSQKQIEEKVVIKKKPKSKSPIERREKNFKDWNDQHRLY